MSEINFSNYDRNLLEEIKYHLEAVALGLKGVVEVAEAINKPDRYETDRALINLDKVAAITKSINYPVIFFYFADDRDGPEISKHFETVEARDAEYDRLKGVVMKHEKA